MFSRSFWEYSTERAVKTFAQSALAFLGAGTAGLFAIDWAALVSVAGLAALLSLLTSVVSLKSDRDE